MTYGEIVNDMASWLPEKEIALRESVANDVRDMLKKKRVALRAAIPENKVWRAEKTVCRLFGHISGRLHYEEYLNRGSNTPRQKSLERLNPDLYEVARIMSPTARMGVFFQAFKARGMNAGSRTT